MRRFAAPVQPLLPLSDHPGPSLALPQQGCCPCSTFDLRDRALVCFVRRGGVLGGEAGAEVSSVAE